MRVLVLRIATFFLHWYSLINMWHKIKRTVMSAFYLCNYNPWFMSAGVKDIKVSSLSQLLLGWQKRGKNSKSLLDSTTHIYTRLLELCQVSGISIWIALRFEWGEGAMYTIPLIVPTWYCQDVPHPCLYGFIRSRWHPGSNLGHRNFLVKLPKRPFC